MNVTPLQFGGSTSILLLGGFVFVLIFLAVLGVVFRFTDPFGGDPWDDFADACHKIVDSENADAIVFLPYSDGPLVPKPGIYDRDLMGGKGGYRTPDGDQIYVDGEGSGKFSLQGVDAILAIDPTEHASGVDPLKSWIAQENDVGRWIQVDKEGSVIEAGEALKSLDGDEPAMEMSLDDSRQAVADGGSHVSEVHAHAAQNGMSLDEAKAELEQRGLLHKIVDIAPPTEMVVDDETGEVEIETASHVGVDLSAASNLLPKKTNTTSLQVMEEKARQEGRDEDKLLEWAGYGFVAGAAASGVTAVVVALVLGFT